MNQRVIVTCAVTGSGNTVGKSPHVPVTPEQIAVSALEAADAGAGIVHCHVRDPETGTGVRTVALYKEVVERIREVNTEVIINLTSGMGGDLMIGDDDPFDFQPGTDLVNGIERLAHVEELLPDICSLDCGTLNFGEGNSVYISTPDMLRKGAKLVQDLGVKPELECFDTGNVWFASQMVAEGLIDEPPLFQLCMGIPYGMPMDVATLTAMVNFLPRGANWTSFGIGSNQMPMVAQTIMLGGHVRVGLEDNLYLERGVKATNAQLVEKAIKIIELLGSTIQTPVEARATLGLKPA